MFLAEVNFTEKVPAHRRAARTSFFHAGLSCVIFSTRLFLGLIQPMNSGLEAQESVVMTIKPDPAKTIFWSRLSTPLHSNGIKPQRGKKLVEKERKKNPPRLVSVKKIFRNSEKNLKKKPKQNF